MQTLFSRYPALRDCEDMLLSAEALLINTFEKGGKLLLCGNGGSAADCEHIAGELMKGFLLPRPLSYDEKLTIPDEKLADSLQGGLPCVCLTGFPALSTAVQNDNGGELPFAQQAWALCRPGDCLMGISTSGNARNVFYAAQAAKAKGASLLGLTGEKGGKLLEISDVCIRVPERETFKVQELHLPVYHWLCMRIEEHFFG